MGKASGCRRRLEQGREGLISLLRKTMAAIVFPAAGIFAEFENMRMTDEDSISPGVRANAVPAASLSGGDVALQSLAGLGSGVLTGFLGYGFGFALADCEDEEMFCGIAEGMAGAALGYGIGTAFGIWSVGENAGGRVSFPYVLGESMLGLATGALLIAITDSGAPGPTAAAITLSNLVTVSLYQWSDRRLRAKFALHPRDAERGGALSLALGAEWTILRW